MQTTMTKAATYVYGVASAASFPNGHSPVGVPGIGGLGAPVRTN